MGGFILELSDSSVYMTGLSVHAPKTSRSAEHTSPRVAYALTAFVRGTIRLSAPRAASRSSSIQVRPPAAMAEARVARDEVVELTADNKRQVLSLLALQLLY